MSNGKERRETAMLAGFRLLGALLLTFEPRRRADQRHGNVAQSSIGLSAGRGVVPLDTILSSTHTLAILTLIRGAKRMEMIK